VVNATSVTGALVYSPLPSSAALGSLVTGLTAPKRSLATDEGRHGSAPTRMIAQSGMVGNQRQTGCRTQFFSCRTPFDPCLDEWEVFGFPFDPDDLEPFE
jgi:hypothetical protein